MKNNSISYIRNLPTLTIQQINRTLARETGLPYSHVSAVIDGFTKMVFDQLVAGGKVTIKNFGLFYPRESRKTRGYDIVRGKFVALKPMCLPDFKPSMKFRKAVKKNVKPRSK